MVEMKTSYKKFQVGQEVMLNKSVVCEGKHFDSGHRFTIISFPPCTIPTKHQYFVYGKDVDNNPIRCEIDDIVKL